MSLRCVIAFLAERPRLAWPPCHGGGSVRQQVPGLPLSSTARRQVGARVRTRGVQGLCRRARLLTAGMAARVALRLCWFSGRSDARQSYNFRGGLGYSIIVSPCNGAADS